MPRKQAKTKWLQFSIRQLLWITTAFAIVSAISPVEIILVSPAWLAVFWSGIQFVRSADVLYGFEFGMLLMLAILLTASLAN